MVLGKGISGPSLNVNSVTDLRHGIPQWFDQCYSPHGSLIGCSLSAWCNLYLYMLPDWFFCLQGIKHSLIGCSLSAGSNLYYTLSDWLFSLRRL